MALLSNQQQQQQYNSYHEYSTTKMTIFQNDYFPDDRKTTLSRRKDKKGISGVYKEEQSDTISILPRE